MVHMCIRGRVMGHMGDGNRHDGNTGDGHMGDGAHCHNNA